MSSGLIVESIVEYTPHMETIQVVLDLPLLRAADRAAKRVRVNRSALIREALRTYLKTLQTRDLEHRDRQGYEAQPDSSADFGAWERVEVWPEE
jgi:hypothetical protein